MSGDSVTVYVPLKFNSSEENQSEIAKRLAANTVAVDSLDESWRRLSACDFKPVYNGEGDVVYKYSLKPPCLNSNGECVDIKKKNHGKAKTINKVDTKVWCMSPINKQRKTGTSASYRTMSPTDCSRYKTIIKIKGELTNWDVVWKKLRKSLQGGQLEDCNAYCKQSQEIVIYHTGVQQAEVGEWIWKNIYCDYSKNTFMVLNI